MSAPFLLCLAVVIADVEVGDKVVTLTTAPAMSGSEKLAEVEPGVELTVKGVNGSWVLVSVPHEDKEIRGWILESNLVAEPRLAFGKLVVHHWYDWDLDKKRERAHKKFESADKNSDAVLTLDEFLQATRKCTLDDLNQHLRQIQAEKGHPKRGTPGFALMYLEMSGYAMHEFEGWRTDWMEWLAETHSEAPSKVAVDFLRTGDVRRSRLAQQYLDNEDATARSRKSRALFQWADRNANGSLTLQEINEALNTLSVPWDEGHKPSASDVPHLVEDLQHNSHVVRKDAAKALGDIGRDAEAAVEVLSTALQDEKYIVRNYALKALDKIGPESPAAVPALVNLLRDPDSAGLRVAACRALGTIGREAKEAIPVLTELLRDQNRAVQRAAEQALGKIQSD